MKKLIKIILLILVVVILIPVCYVAYVFIAFHRLGDMDIVVQGTAPQAAIQKKTEYKIVSYNIGFGAYEDDYGFFMDGGTQSWAWSKERLDTNLKNIGKTLKDQDADIYFIQEVDIDSTRSYHFDQRKYMSDALPNKSYTFAQNYDSPFLFYPIFQPHGASKSGLMVFSNYTIQEAKRYELPIETGLYKLLDLDRCYSKNKISVDGGRELVLYNFHLSAYTSDGTIATEQLKILVNDMEIEYNKGNYIIAGGDFNKDLLIDSSVYFGKSDIEYTWAQPMDETLLNAKHITKVAPLDEANPVPSCRNADGPYHVGQYVLTIDGFLVTQNVEVMSSNVINTNFKYSDHNPVYMTFKLI